MDGTNVDSTKSWLYELKEEALRRGVRSEVIDRAFEGVTISEKILEIDKNRPEVKLTAEEYLNRYFTLNSSLC
jgi:membrane-bound lytic murein transglycosylase B